MPNSWIKAEINFAFLHSCVVGNKTHKKMTSSGLIFVYWGINAKI